MDEQLWAGKITRRGVTRVHRIAWTVADLEGHDQPDERDVDVALRLRAGAPLLSATVEGRAVS